MFVSSYNKILFSIVILIIYNIGNIDCAVANTMVLLTNIPSVLQRLVPSRFSFIHQLATKAVYLGIAIDKST